MIPRWLPRALAATLLAAASACAPTDSVRASASPSSALPSVTASAIGVPEPAVAVDMKVAWPGLAPHIVRSLADADHVLYFTAVSPDAKWVLGQLRARQSSSTERPWIVMVNVDSGQLVKLHELASTSTQAGLTDADDRWFVWAEATQQPNLGDWTIYAFDRMDTRLIKVASAQPLADGTYLPSSVWPHVDRGLVVWSQEHTAAGDRVGDLLTFQLPAGPAIIAATPSRGGAVAWPYLAWSPLSPAETIVRKDLRSGSTQSLHLPGLTYATIAGEGIAWVANVRELWYQSGPSASPRLVARASTEDGFLQFPKMSERIIGWESISFSGVYDRVLDRLVLLDTPGKPVGWNFVAKGQALMWALPIDPQTQAAQAKLGLTAARDFAVLDLSGLPNTRP